MLFDRTTLWRGRQWDQTNAEWALVWFFLGSDTLEVRSTKDPRTTTHRIPLCEIDALNEFLPFDEDPAVIEILCGGAAVLHASIPQQLLQNLTAALASSADATPPSTADPQLAVGAALGAGRSRSSWRARGCVAAALLAVVVIGTELPLAEDAVSGALVGSTATSPRRSRPPTTSQNSETPTPSSTTAAPTPSSTISTAAPSTTLAAPSGTAIAPLTGLSAPAASLNRNAIVSKIDASPDAMPQVGLDLADLIYEVKIEWGSRYIAVWHSQVPAVIGPHRSARTTDPDLLAQFGHPLFAFSGANRGVVQALALTTWKTGVGPGEVPDAWFRDEQRPFPHNLFAFGAAPGGLPVVGFETYPGVKDQFRWDAELNGWRHRIWEREHVHPNGAPVAPRNVVVLETAYTTSWADPNSPEAISVGAGRAWVFTGGTVRAGTWGRSQRTDPWNLRDAAGVPLTLDPGTTWVVLAEGEPKIQGQ